MNKIHIPRRTLERLLDRCWTHAEIADYFGCGRSTITKRIKEYGIHVPKRPMPTPEQVRQLHDQGLGCYEIAARCGCSHTTILRRLRQGGES